MTPDFTLPFVLHTNLMVFPLKFGTSLFLKVISTGSSTRVGYNVNTATGTRRFVSMNIT